MSKSAVLSQFSHFRPIPRVISSVFPINIVQSGQSQIQITHNTKLSISSAANPPDRASASAVVAATAAAAALSSPLSFVNRFCLIWTEGQRGKEKERVEGRRADGLKQRGRGQRGKSLTSSIHGYCMLSSHQKIISKVSVRRKVRN